MMNEACSPDSLLWYKISSFGSILSDPVRMKAYVAALKQSMFPGAVVVDLGAGTGFFSLLACKFGAKRVYAIEPNPVVTLLERQALDNGFEDRIEIIRDVSSHINLPELADVLVCDLRGAVGPLYQWDIVTLYDARQRLLKPNGIMIPQRDILYATLVQNEDFYKNEVMTPWRYENYDVDMSSIVPYAVNVPREVRLIQDHTFLSPKQWGEIVYGEREDPSINATLEWQVEKEGTVHFISLWFKAVLVDGISFTNGPVVAREERAMLYKSRYFPLETPINLMPGDTITIELRAHHVASNGDYLFNWNTSVIRANDSMQNIAFKQSSLANDLSFLVGATILRKEN